VGLPAADLIEDRRADAGQKRSPPTGTVIGPRRTEAELVYADGNWRPDSIRLVRLDVVYRQPITDRWIFWLVRLRLRAGEGCLRLLAGPRG
jgi:hypothetical protein